MGIGLWFRGPWWRLLLWMAIMWLWWLGGWQLLRLGFDWPLRRTRLFVAWGVGLALYLWGIVWIGRVFPAPWMYVLPALLIAGIGGWIEGRHWLVSLRQWLQAFWEARFGLLAWLLLFWVMTGIELGTYLFDDYHHPPLISLLAAGFVPPRNPLDPHLISSYHYAFNLLGASLVQLGGLFPWSAFDVSKALLWSYTATVAWYFGYTIFKQGVWQIGFTVVILFAGGTRYLLLLLPLSVLRLLSTGIAGPYALEKLLTGVYPPEEVGLPLPLPLAFGSGLLYPYTMAHAGPSNLGRVLLFLLLILYFHIQPRNRKGTGILVPLFALLALTWEIFYLFLLAGTLLMVLWAWYHREAFPWQFRVWLSALGLSLLPALVQGGPLTFFVAQHLGWVQSENFVPQLKFALQWPPAFMVRYVGMLPLHSWKSWPILFAEMGTGMWLFPWTLLWLWKGLRRNFSAFVLYGILGSGAVLALLFPAVARFYPAHDIARITAYGIYVWALLLLPRALFSWKSRYPRRFLLGVGALSAMVLPGLVLGLLALPGMVRPKLSLGITPLDAQIARRLWNTLPRETVIFDPMGWPAVTITGRYVYFGHHYTHPYPQVATLVRHPSLPQLRKLGVQMIYVRKAWWDTLSPEARQALTQPCVRTVAEVVRTGAKPDFRRFLDIRACGP